MTQEKCVTDKHWTDSLPYSFIFANFLPLKCYFVFPQAEHGLLAQVGVFAEVKQRQIIPREAATWYKVIEALFFT